MNINGIYGGLRFNPYARTSANGKISQDFGSTLTATRNAAQTSSSSSVPCMDLYPEGVTSLENRIFWCASPGQNLFVEYAENSTPEDPIVRIRATSYGKSYDFTRHINDIDPTNASFAEMGALAGHIRQTGEYNESIKNSGMPVPTGYEIGSYMQKQNFMARIGDIASSNMFSQNIILGSADYLEMYSKFIQDKQEAEQTAEFDTLMNAVDNIIDGKAPMEPKEILERLSEPARDTLEDMKAGEDVSKSEWTDFCKELQDIGVITEDEFNSVRADIQLVPAGYELHPVMVRELKAMYARSQGIYVDTEMWTGDPFEYLTSWAALMDDWQDMLEALRNPNGTVKYTDFSPIDKQIEACTKVGEVVNGLLEQFE